MKNTKITEFLKTYFDEYLNKKSIFVNRDVLTDNYIPPNVKYRESEIAQISYTLAPLLKKEKASNLLLFGPPGTGKTLSIKFVSQHMLKSAIKANVNLKVVYINCRFGRVSKSEYYLIKEILEKLGVLVKDGVRMEDMYHKLFEILGKENVSVLLILDEIDKLINNLKDDFLYFLTREYYYTNKTNLCFVGISNNLSFLNIVDPRILSSLDAYKLRFSPYDALQLTEILKDRARLAFREGVVSESIIKYIAGWVAKESGDARKALNILKLAGEIADSTGCEKITMSHVEEAIQKVDLDPFLSLIDSLVLHHKVLLLSILEENLEKEYPSFTDIFNKYSFICESIGVKPLSKDTISQKLKELEMIFEGYFNIETISFGKEGRKKVIKIILDNKKIKTAIDIIKSQLYYE